MSVNPDESKEEDLKESESDLCEYFVCVIIIRE